MNHEKDAWGARVYPSLNEEGSSSWTRLMGRAWIILCIIFSGLLQIIKTVGSNVVLTGGLWRERDELRTADRELFQEREHLKDQCRALETEITSLKGQLQSLQETFLNTSTRSFEEFLMYMAKTTYGDIPWTEELAFKHFLAVLDHFENAAFSHVFPLTRRSIPWPDLGDPRQALYGYYHPIKEETVRNFFSSYRAHASTGDDVAYYTVLKRMRNIFRPANWNGEMTLATVSDPQPLIEAGLVIFNAVNIELVEICAVLAPVKDTTPKRSPNSRRVSGQRVVQSP